MKKFFAFFIAIIAMTVAVNATPIETAKAKFEAKKWTTNVTAMAPDVTMVMNTDNNQAATTPANVYSENYTTGTTNATTDNVAAKKVDANAITTTCSPSLNFNISVADKNHFTWDKNAANMAANKKGKMVYTVAGFKDDNTVYNIYAVSTGFKDKGQSCSATDGANSDAANVKEKISAAEKNANAGNKNEDATTTMDKTAAATSPQLK